jgi:replicative DNA helicase
MKLVQKIVQGFNRCSVDKTREVSIIENTERKFNGKPLYLGYSYQKPEHEAIIETLKEAVRRYGLKFLVFDHLHFLCRSISNQVQEIGLAVQAFKFLAEEMEIPIILIAQPRKIQPDMIMTSADLKDSSAIFSDCDHLVILHRKRVSSGRDTIEGKQAPHSQAYEPITLVRVEASRYNPGGEALLYFHGSWSRFDVLENKEK